MRIDVFKLVFIGLEKDQRSFFQRAQEAGLIEFIRKDRSRHSDVPEPILKLNHALKILGSLPPTEQEESLPSYSTEHLVNQVLHFQEERESALEEIKLLHLEMDRVEIFGSFQLEDIAFIENHSNYRVRFFQAKEDDAIDEDPALILIGRDAFLRYYISIDQDFQPKAPLIEMQVDRPWNALQSALEGAKLRLAKAERELHSLEKWKKFLSHALLAKLDSFHLESAAQSGQLALENRLFSVEGWAPKNKLEDLHRLAQASDVYLEEVGLEEGERIPTYLENHGAAQVGQDLVEIYDTPSNKDKDPSLWVFGGFLLFFSMIVGDAGYGLVYLLLTLYLGCKFKPSTPKGIRFFKLATLLSVSTILMGLFSNSILAIPISLDNPLMSISIKQRLVEAKASYHMKHKDETYQMWVKKHPILQQAKTPTQFLQGAVCQQRGGEALEMQDKFADQIMLELSLFIGAIHLILSLLRYIGRNYSHWGWIAFIIGGYLYFPEYLQATSFNHFLFHIPHAVAKEAGLQLMVSGMGLAFLLSFIQNGLGGFLEVMNLLQVFGDILSYLRLYALGMAGAIVASTINDMASGLPIVLSIVLLIIGHGMNITLGIMGGVIHGLRLNFLEFYHYSFEGGGKNFQPLKLLSKL